MAGVAPLPEVWLASFDATLVRYFAVDHVAAGADAAILQRYVDLPGDQAAMEFAGTTIWRGWTGGRGEEPGLSPPSSAHAHRRRCPM